MNSINTSFFQSLLKAMPGRTCVLDPNLEVIACNDAFILFMQEGYGITTRRNEAFLPDEELGLPVWMLLVHEALNGRSMQEVVNLGSEELDFYARIDIKPLGDGDEKLGVLIEVNDVTEEKSNELYLSAFKQLAWNLPNTDVFLCDDKMNVLIAGGGEMKKYNERPASFEGKNMFDLACEFDLEFLHAYYRKGMQGEASRVEYPYNQVHYSVEVYPVMEGRKVKNIIVLAKNITELKCINLRLQQLSQTKDNILNVVAHDLRNPVSAILSIIDLAKDNQGNMLADSHSMIEHSCNVALSTINDLLDISELGKEDYILETETTYLNDFINELLLNNKMLAESKHINLTFESEESDVFTNLNPDKFSRAMNNLLTNAIKFSHPQQQVVISTARKKKKVLISIRDEGIGIPKEMQEHIFDEFTSAGRRGTAGEKSVGLGMSIVKQIVLLHKGNIWVESEENKGTTVNIELDSAI